MIDSMVTWLANLLQNEPKGAAALLIGLATWTLMNTIIIACTNSSVEGIRKALRKRGIWV